MKAKNKILAMISGVLLLSNMIFPTTALAFAGEIFMASTVDGHTLIYEVLTEDTLTNTGTVQVGDGASVALVGAASGSLTIPETVANGGITYTVTAVGDHAFQSCSGFTGSLTIPANVQTIGDNAFYNCYQLSGNLNIPGNVTAIGTSAFYGCNSFTGGLTIPDTVETIGAEAFMNCYGFTGSLIIGNSVQTIGAWAFCSCSGFTSSLNIPNSVTTIGDYAFFTNSALDGRLMLGNQVQTIGTSAFSDCTNLDNAWFSGDKPTTFGNSVFDRCKSGFTLYYPYNNSTWDGYTYDGQDAIHMEANIAPAIITATVLPGGTFNTEYNQSLEAAGTAPIIWTLATGSTPDGIDLESDGDLSGTPTAEGVFNFSVRAENSAGSDTKAFSIEIVREAGGGAGSSNETYIPRTLTDNATGITLSGNAIHRRAVLTVKEMALHSAGTCAACDAIRKAQEDNQLILGYDISLTQGFHGPLTVSIPVGNRYDGRTVTILHCINGKLETLTATVADGKATFTITSLSPFAVTTGLLVPDNVVANPPKTGDDSISLGWLLLSGASAAAIATLIVLGRKRRPPIQ